MTKLNKRFLRMIIDFAIFATTLTESKKIIERINKRNNRLSHRLHGGTD